MTAAVAFLAGLVEQGEPACVGAEEFAGPLGAALRAWQRLGFLGREPMANPVPGCPHCDGVPYRLGGRYVCNRCRSTVDPRRLLLWRFDAAAFLGWVAKGLHLHGGCRRIDAGLWQLGAWANGEGRAECFFRGRGPLSTAGRSRLLAYRNALVLYALTPPDRDHPSARYLSLLELLQGDDSLSVDDLAVALRSRGTVRFDAHSGALWLGDDLLGEVPPGSKEHAFLAALARQLDHFVPYADLKHEVLRQAGSSDSTEEATFCQNLKRRVKKSIPAIDRLIATTNKADGYRLRGNAVATSSGEVNNAARDDTSEAKR